MTMNKREICSQERLQKFIYFFVLFIDITYVILFNN